MFKIFVTSSEKRLAQAFVNTVIPGLVHFVRLGDQMIVVHFQVSQLSYKIFSCHFALLYLFYFGVFDHIFYVCEYPTVYSTTGCP